jgi:branched-chain amino acid transport system permease protein
METYMSELQDWVTVAQGAVFFIVVLAFREGIVGSLSGLWRKRVTSRADMDPKPETSDGKP